MNSGRPSSGNDSWNDLNAALFSSCHTIDSNSREKQCWSFFWTVDCGIYDGVSRKAIMRSENGVARRLFVYAWFLLRRFQDIFYTIGELGDGFRQIDRHYPVVQQFFDVAFGTGSKRIDDGVIFHEAKEYTPGKGFRL